MAVHILGWIIGLALLTGVLVWLLIVGKRLLTTGVWQTNPGLLVIVGLVVLFLLGERIRK